MGTTLTHRDRAILRAVGGGTAELVATDLYVDGRHCCDQFAARRLTDAGLIVAATRRAPGGRARALLSTAGRAQLAS